jgi:hypothetical protein
LPAGFWLAALAGRVLIALTLARRIAQTPLHGYQARIPSFLGEFTG